VSAPKEMTSMKNSVVPTEPDCQAALAKASLIVAALAQVRGIGIQESPNGSCFIAAYVTEAESILGLPQHIDVDRMDGTSVSVPVRLVVQGKLTF